MSNLKQARREQASAIAALLQLGVSMRRLMERLALEETLAPEMRARAHTEAADYAAACERFARASGARTIAQAERVINHRLRRLRPVTATAPAASDSPDAARYRRPKREEMAARVEAIVAFLNQAGRPQSVAAIAAAIGVEYNTTQLTLTRQRFYRIHDAASGSAVWWLPADHESSEREASASR